jgi:hypothetical protein
MIIKMCGYGFKLYLRNRSNVFDMIIVLLSTADVGIFGNKLMSNEIDLEKGSELEGFGKVTQVFRIFRLLRVFKLAN